MSDFWARKLASNREVTPPPPPSYNQPGTVSSAQAWWNVPIGTPQTPAPVAVNAAPETITIPVNAQAIRNTDHCPNCNSTDYFRPPRNPNAASRCMACGYPVMHELSGVGTGSSGEAAAPSRQIAERGGLASNYQPGTIVDSIR